MRRSAWPLARPARRLIPVASLATALAILVALSLPAKAATYENSREGWMLGFDLGVGSAQLKLKSGSTTNSSDRETGGAGNLRVGYAVRPDLVLGFEGSGWVKKTTESGVDLTSTLSVGTAALTWYPNAGPFYLRLGVGGGKARFEVSQGAGSFAYEKSGFGILGAAGYEFRLTRTFSLGPQLDFGWMDLGDVDLDTGGTASFSANYVNLSAAANWYF